MGWSSVSSVVAQFAFVVSYLTDARDQSYRAGLFLFGGYDFLWLF